MARGGINETDVWQAADALLLEGARPTIERVRMKIGRGSPNTVTPYLETWFRSLGARIADPMAFSSPPAEDTRGWRDRYSAIPPADFPSR